MDGTLLEDLDDMEALETALVRELTELRASHGVLSPQKFQQMQALRRVCGGGDLFDAYSMFEREMRRYTNDGPREAAAAAISITAPAETVLDRLEHVVGALPQDGRIKDQRTGRRWSDAGIPMIAKELAYLAQVQGRLGTEMLTIELIGDIEADFTVDIYQLTTRKLPEQAPLVRIWRHLGEDELQDTTTEAQLDLDMVPPTAAEDDEYTLKRHRLQVQIPQNLHSEDHVTGDVLYSITIEGRDAPMRTVSFADGSAPGVRLQVRFTSYRTISALELLRR